MSRFKEKFQKIDFGPKNVFINHFGHNKNFPWKPKTATFTYLFMPVIVYNFRNILWTGLEKSSKLFISNTKMQQIHYFGHKTFFFKNTFHRFWLIIKP